MSLALVRVDDRLIHGQVIVGWAQALGARRIVVVHDQVRENAWERELYALGVPPGIDVVFASVTEAVRDIGTWQDDGRRTIVLVGSVTDIVRLTGACDRITRVNVGGLHDEGGRRQRLPYVYLSDEEVSALRAVAARGIDVTAQDVPTARPLPLEDWV
jgi:mannose/fructose/N-acetylgalactosamine-specific phosphotransferase system component IIB